MATETVLTVANYFKSRLKAGVTSLGVSRAQVLAILPTLERAAAEPQPAPTPAPPVPTPAPAPLAKTLVSIGPAKTTTEGSGGGITYLVFDVTRSGDTGPGSTVDWAVTGTGTFPAQATDFEGDKFPADKVWFGGGETAKQIWVPIKADKLTETDESFTVTLSNPTGCSITNATALGTITNDDAAVPQPVPAPGPNPAPAPIPAPPAPAPVPAPSPSGFAWPAAGSTLDVSKLIVTYAPAFAGELDEYSLATNPNGAHRTNYTYGSAGDVMTGQYPGPWADKASSRMNAIEEQVYGGNRYAPELGSPFKIVNGALEISAFPNPDPKNPKAINDGGQVAKYISGLISTLPKLTQTYGYFESTGLLPSNGFKGLWAAGVLYGASAPFQYPPPNPNYAGDELDIFEHLSGERGGGVLHFNAHLPRLGWNMPEATVSFDPTKPVTIGLLWTPEKIGWFVERKEVASVANPADGFHRPMLWMHNLAVGPNGGGGWTALNMPADPRAFPGKMVVQKMTAYRLA